MSFTYQVAAVVAEVSTLMNEEVDRHDVDDGLSNDQLDVEQLAARFSVWERHTFNKQLIRVEFIRTGSPRCGIYPCICTLQGEASGLGDA